MGGMGLCFRKTNSWMTEALGMHVCKHLQKKCSDHVCCSCASVLSRSVSTQLCFIPSTHERIAGFTSEQYRDYKPQWSKARLLLSTCVSPSTLTSAPTALLHMKAAFYHLTALPFAIHGTAVLPRLICRKASETSLVFCTIGQWLKIWKALIQRAILLGKQGKHLLFLPYTCLWVTQPLSAKLRPAQLLALRACLVPKPQPAVTS